MGSELALSGLASGFDWQPVVEQLIELEAIPKKRLQLEKQQNNEKMSELGLLKGQLDTLKGAATALQNDDLFEARKGSLDEDAAKFMAANIKAGAMTGSYKIEVSLLGSSTSMSSIRRKPLGLGKALHLSASNFAVTGLDIKLKDLPLQTAITKGTFTVSSRTYEITNLDETLQELMDRIAADPEDDQTAVSLEYDSKNDKMIVDGNELINDPSFTDTPILGSPTDTSNFLKVLRLLDQVSLNRDADYEGSSGISIWSGSSASLANPEKAAWLRQDDKDENAGAGLAANDDKIYTANGIPTGKEVLYRRKAVHDQYEATKGYSALDVVYRHGYLYEAKLNFPNTAWTKIVDTKDTAVSLSALSHDFWQLKKALSTDRVGASTGQATFSAAVSVGAAGQYHIPTASTAVATGLDKAYKAGDVVKAEDGSYFRAVQDRKLTDLTSTEDFGNIGQALVTSKNANAGGWTTIAGVAGAPDEFRPNHIFVKGRIYEAKTTGGATYFGSTNGFAEHDGAAGQVNFSGDDLVVGNVGDATVNKKFYRADTAWNGVDPLPSTATAHPTLWTAGQFVQADDNNFYEAHADWANVTTHSTTKNYDPAVASLKYVHTTGGATNFYEAHANWTNVTDFANGGSVDNTYATGKYVFHTGQNKFYQAQQDFKDIAAKAERTIYNVAGTMAQKFVKDASGPSTNFYKAKAAWANVSAYTENTAVAGISTNDYRQLTTNVAAGAGGADGRIYKALADLNLIAAHNTKVNYKPSETLDKQIVINGGNYFQAAADRAKEEFNAAGAGLTSGQIGGMGLNQRALDTVAGKTFAAKDNLALILAHDATVNYEPALGLGSEVVEDGGQFYKFTHGDGKLAKHAFGAGGLSAANAMAMAAGERALDNVAGKAFSAKALLGTINARVLNTNYAQNALIESGGDFFKAKLTNLAEATFNLPVGISDLSIVDNNDHLMDIGNDRVFSAQMALKDTINHQADASYDPSGTLNDKLRTVGGLAGAFYTPSQVIDFTNGFSNNSSYATSTSIVKEGGQYYQFSDVYAGLGGGVTANNGEWVQSLVDSKFYKNTSGGNLSDDPGLGGLGWTVSSGGGQTTLAGMVAQGEMATNVTTFVTDPAAGGNTLWTDFTNDVKKPSGTNDYWTQETNATTPGANQPAGNAFWEKITDDVTKPVSGVANDFWTDEPLATTLGTNAFWTEVTNDVIKPTATTDYWNEVTAAVANFGDPVYWTNVTDAVTLNGQDAAAANTAYWQDVTSDIVTFPAGGTLVGGSIQDDFWEYVPEIAITAPLGSGVNDGYWQEVSSTLTDLTNAAWWTDASGALKDKSDGAWWTDETTTLNDLTNTNWWGEITAELTNPANGGFGDWWSEIAHANGDGAGQFDPNYWQQIKPGMKRVGKDALGKNIVMTNAVDHSIWSQIGNLDASPGNDGTFGLHDTNEAALRPTQAVQPYAGGTTYSPGTILEATDLDSGVLNYYKARVLTTNKDPADPLNADDWELLGPKSSMTEDEAYGYTYTDPIFWKQNDTPTPGVTAGWADYWDTLTETVLTSSQPLGAVSLTEKIADANFDAFVGGNFSATGDVFYIGDGTGAVRIDYNVNDDTVADLIQRVNDSDANVTMYYDPVGDKLVVQNNADGAIGITLHERPLEAASIEQPDGVWDSLTANQATGNILELMGLATPVAETDYTAFNSLATYSKGTYVKETIGLTTTYWQALDDVLAGGSLDRSNPKWEQVARGVARAASSELGNNYAIKINDGETIYNNTASFDETVHGYEGITFDVSGGAVGDEGTVKIERDSNPARNAIGKFVEEFNDAQDYVRSLVAVNQDGDNITAGTFSSNIEISRLGSQLRKIVFGDSYVHSESKIAQDGTDLTVSTYALLTSVQADLALGASDAGYQVKIKADESVGAHTIGDTTYQEWNGSAWVVYTPQFSSFRLADIGLDFGTGSDRLQMKDSSKLTTELLNNPDKVQALFAEATATADDKNTGTANRQYQGVSFDLNDFLSNFLSGDSDSDYKGTYQAHAESIRAQNKRIDDRIEDLERYLEQRERALTQGFIRMEEMQSKISTQMQTLTNSFANNKK